MWLWQYDLNVTEIYISCKDTVVYGVFSRNWSEETSPVALNTWLIEVAHMCFFSTSNTKPTIQAIEWLVT